MKLPDNILGAKVNAVSIAITALVVGIAGVFIYRKSKLLISGIGTKREEKDYIKNSKVNLNQLSYDKSWYIGAADRLQSAFEGAGTTWSTVEDVVSKIKNKSDWNQLVAEFGIFTARSGMDMWPIKPTTGNLMTWLEEELDSREMRRIQETLLDADVTL